jgi:NitT/TauT family transport system substrate-binding protein
VPRLRSLRPSLAGVLAVLVLTLALTGAPVSGAEASPGGTLPRLATAQTVRIGFFANLTHAPALVAQELRLFRTLLGKDRTSVEFVLFNAGPAVIEAMKGGAIDMAYIGPTPAVTGFAGTRGTLLRVVGGATSGGAQLVVRSSIDSAKELEGKKIATPQLGNTQDVALRSWLKRQGLSTTISGGGDVPVYPTTNATTLALFRKGEIDGAWVPEPWASRLVIEGGGRVLVDEKSLWPRGEFITTTIIATQDFLGRYPGTVRSVLQANSSAITYMRTNEAKAKDLVQRQMRTWTGKPLPAAVIDRSWRNLDFTWDPLPLTLKKNADDAVSVGLLPAGSNDIKGIYDLRLLNQLLDAARKRPVDAQGLGAD